MNGRALCGDISRYRDDANSADPQAFCLDQYCSAHEFCGGTRCRCRALFASKYKPTNALGEPTVCTQSSATVTLAGCLMEDKGIDYSVLQLNDPNCKGHMDDQTHMVTFSYNSSNICGTEVTTNNSQIMYKNSIVTRNSSMHGVITCNDQIEINFSCFYTKPEIKSVSFTIKDSSVVQRIVSGVWNYTVMMNAYTDPGRMQLVGPSSKLKLNQKIWLELKTEGLDGNMVAIVTDSCWATSQPSPDSSLRYDLVIEGCPNPADQMVTMEGNGHGSSSCNLPALPDGAVPRTGPILCSGKQG
ncbi:uromodulin-like [Sebastes fasciatus]|uniref:uromodulin-like n=1 Tax=Sebastes fasciatus TaxID=394691 RepID=UPI003D9DFC2B